MKSIRTDVFRLTPQEMADAIGVSTATISRWDLGHMRPSVTAILVILAEAKKRGVTLDQETLMTIASTPLNPPPKRHRNVKAKAEASAAAPADPTQPAPEPTREVA